MNAKKYSDELINYIRSINKGKKRLEIAKIVKENLGIELNRRQVDYIIKKNKITGCYDGQFKKGHPSFNKGLKQTDYMNAEAIERTKATRFKSGFRPHNTKEVGTEVITADGYIKVKVAEPNVWKYKHRLIWEEANGPIPKDSKILFLDGNKLNCDINNLECISKKVGVVICKEHLIYNEADLTKIGINLAKLSMKISERKKK